MNRYASARQSDGGQTKPASSTADASASERDWAICCSGGGIRSASFSLGGLQALEQGGLLKRARWIIGVSGGGYIAAAHALTAHGLASHPGQSAKTSDGHSAADHVPAYAPGTVEERNLRNNTHYLAPSAGVALAGIMSMLAGVVITSILVLAPLYALTHAWGWLLRWQAVLTPSGEHGLAAAIHPWAWILPAAVAAVTVALFAWWRVTLAPHDLASSAQDPDMRVTSAVAWGTSAALALATLTLAVPFAAAWFFSSSGVTGSIVHFFGFGSGISWTPAAVAGLIAAVAASAKTCREHLAAWQEAGLKGGSGLVSRVGTWARQRLLPWLGSIVIVAGALACMLLWTGDGARSGFTVTQLVPVLIALGIMLFTRLVADVNHMSLHDLYRWRLGSAYAVTRTTPGANATSAAATPAALVAVQQQAVPVAQPTPSRLLSQLAGDQPGLVICATANINAARESPPGQTGFCLAFDPARVTLRREQGSTAGDPGSPAGKPAEAVTEDYETMVGRRRLTLFDISAISGAAFSPLMGSATREAYRILFTVANLRLGVWLPHPRVVGGARDYLGLPRTKPGTDDAHGPKPDKRWTRHPLLLLLWYVMPHPWWAKQKGRNDDREAMLWAHVLERRLRGRGAVWYWMMQPTLGLLWAEAIGHTSYRSTWIYATDGGHHDNLGLVEALRRGAERIIVLDASGDKADSWRTLGAAIALARADVGVDIKLDPTTMIKPDSGDRHELSHGEVFRPWAYGTFSRRTGSPSKGEIWVCKLGWWQNAPWDVRAYAAAHDDFPGKSTAEQLYDGAEFEAYRELGAAAVLDAAQRGKLPLSDTRPSGPLTRAAALLKDGWDRVVNDVP